jgi:hypothetical protein
VETKGVFFPLEQNSARVVDFPNGQVDAVDIVLSVLGGRSAERSAVSITTSSAATVDAPVTNTRKKKKTQ